VDGLTAWVEGYLRAWRSNDPDEIGALFSDDAEYFTEPFREPWRGREGIVEGWLARKDEGGWEFEWRPLLLQDELGVVTGTTRYREPPHVYSNLWTIRFDPDGRCREFTKWWMLQPEAE
jgi:hypothetical protein